MGPWPSLSPSLALPYPVFPVSCSFPPRLFAIRIRDCVDTTLFDVQHGVLDERYILKALLGGVNKQLDKQTI